MSFYQRQGAVPPKHFTVLRDEAGQLRYEELISSLGFDGPSSLLYRLRPPTRTLHVEPLAEGLLERWDPGTVRNHLLAVDRVKGSGDEVSARVPLFVNDDVVYSISRPTEPGERFYRNGYGDELVLVVEGSGVLETTFGELDYGPLDMVVVPRGTTWRLRPGQTSHTLVVLEARSSIQPPARYRSRAGQFLSRSLYSERDLRPPVLRDPRDETDEFAIAVRTGDRLASHTVPHHPFDVVGWDGALYPYALNLRDVEPIAGRVHLMPDVHQVMACEGAVICAITPNRLPDHPDSYPAQADHSADCDEIFYRFASDGPALPGLGTITLHTRAMAHGPKPGFEHARLPERSPLWGLIVDLTRPVHLAAAAADADDPGYVRAWT